MHARAVPPQREGGRRRRQSLSSISSSSSCSSSSSSSKTSRSSSRRSSRRARRPARRTSRSSRLRSSSAGRFRGSCRWVFCARVRSWPERSASAQAMHAGCRSFSQHCACQPARLLVRMHHCHPCHASPRPQRRSWRSSSRPPAQSTSRRNSSARRTRSTARSWGPARPRRTRTGRRRWSRTGSGSARRPPGGRTTKWT